MNKSIYNLITTWISQVLISDMKGGLNMKSKKILNAIPIMQELDESNLDLVISAINSCRAVQALNELRNTNDFSNQIEKLKPKVN